MQLPSVLPSHDEMNLVLIAEELKSCKFFSALRTVGFEDGFYQTNLSSLILANAGFAEETNELLGAYFALLERYSEELDANDQSLKESALKFYAELVALKK